MSGLKKEILEDSVYLVFLIYKVITGAKDKS